MRLIVALILAAIVSFAAALDEDVNRLFCQLNEYALVQTLNGQDVFPCTQEE
jgi:hypothetical protein